MNKLFGNLGLGSACTVQLSFTSATEAPPPTITLKNKQGATETVPLLSNKDSITGTVKVAPIPGKRVEHQGIRVQLVGEIELASERGHPYEFLSPVRDLAPPGELHSLQTFPFEFRSVEMQYESYRGMQVRLRYMLRVTVVRGLGQSVVKDYPFWVQNPTEDIPPAGDPIKMEVGIEDCLHIEFEYDRAGYHLTDTVIGKIYFLLVRIKLKHMELEIKRRETVGGGVSARAESETVAKYEIMDGAPARGEVIPIRLHLSPYDLTPSYPNVHNKFGVRYSINLVLVDDEDRRYFKQQEITLYRVPPSQGKENKSLSGGLGAMEANGGRAPAVTPRTAARAMSGEGHAVATPEKGFGAAGAAGGSPGTNESPGDIRFGDDGDGAEERGAAGQEADTGPPL